ncbi:putative DNA-binding protein [Yoonia maricola]|uniref:Putative DNA-binding protein n=1 Tax=Yoonia maricola TaxID=420999 RepID=A0A2M8W226_9RHOB|nr:RNA-binding domain-containing protein [Yoonia maricola]PJI84977.1 putative DNA-binding protein [Yoonia maricola]
MSAPKELIELAQSTNEESDLLDFKREYSPQKKAAFWAETIKDIVAFANTRGGILVFGVNDDGTPSGIDCDTLYELDSASLADQVRKYTATDFIKMSVISVVRDKKPFPAILIGRVHVPLVFAKVGTYEVQDGNQKTAFSKGTVYFRHGSKSEPCTRADLEEFLRRELDRVREDWLGNIRKVVEAPHGSSVVITQAGGGQAGVRITNDPNAPALHLPKLSDGFPYKQNQLIKEVIRRTGIDKLINSHDVQTVKLCENINEESRPDFVSKPHEGSSPQYSQDFVDLIVQRFENDSDYFSKCRKAWKEAMY